jgi:hypothetical protein
MDLNQVMESGVLDSKTGEWIGFDKTKDDDVTVRMIGGLAIVDSYFYRDGKFKTSVNYPKGHVPHKVLRGIEPKFRAMVQIVERTEEGDFLKKYSMPKSVLKQITDLKTTKNWEYESLPDYDLVINKTGVEIDTRYNVTPSPNKEPLSKEVLEEFEESQKIEEYVLEQVPKDLNKILKHEGLDLLEDNDDEISIDDLPF